MPKFNFPLAFNQFRCIFGQMDTVSALMPVKRRKITLEDLNAIAKLCSKRITETGACLIIGIDPNHWMVWKTRHKRSVIFDKAITRIREAKLDACIESIDSAGDNADIKVGDKVITKRGDWRAKAWLAERVLAPERLGDRQQPTNETNVLISDDSIAKVIALFSQSKHRALDQGNQTTTSQASKTEAIDCEAVSNG